jgi:hypothetical protein
LAIAPGPLDGCRSGWVAVAGRGWVAPAGAVAGALVNAFAQVLRPGY